MIQFPCDAPWINPIVLNFFKWYESRVSDISSNSRMIQTQRGWNESMERIFIRNGSDRALKRETFFIIALRGMIWFDSPSSPPIVINGSRTSGGILAGIAESPHFLLQTALFIVLMIVSIWFNIWCRDDIYREYLRKPSYDSSLTDELSYHEQDDHFVYLNP